VEVDILLTVFVKVNLRLFEKKAAPEHSVKAALVISGGGQIAPHSY
jgi:hypothetical protein